MASARVKPKLKAPIGKGVVLRKVRPIVRKSTVVGPIFNRLTVVWVQNNGVPFDTTGFFARLQRGRTVVQTASFDRFGVVRFSNVRTLTNVSYTLRLFSPSGVEFRVRTIPAGVETFAVIG